MNIQAPQTRSNCSVDIDILCSDFKNGFKHILFSVDGETYMVRLQYDERPMIKAHLFAAGEQLLGILDFVDCVDQHGQEVSVENFVDENGQVNFVGNFVDENGDDYDREGEPRPWRGAPKYLARKIIKVAKLHRAKREDWVKQCRTMQ
jgi:hypothetical protein